MSYSLEATYHRTALLLGLLTGEEVHRWAERVIERERVPPDEVVDLVSVSSTDLSALRHALWPLVVDPEPLAVLRGILALLHADLEPGRRGVADTVTVMRQMRSMLRLPTELYAELNAVLVEQSSRKTAVPEWLQSFANEHLELFRSHSLSRRRLPTGDPAMPRCLALTAVAVALLGPVGMHAQAPTGAANRAAMDQLEFMVGRWRGEAWMQRGTERVQTTMTETVERKLGGVVLQVEGLGVIPGADSMPQRVVHHAFAIISFDSQAKTYGLRSYIASGQFGDFTVSLVPGGVSWSREVPGGRVRNTAKISDGSWHEVGEFSRDGVDWVQIMEMRLHREP